MEKSGRKVDEGQEWDGKVIKDSGGNKLQSEKQSKSEASFAF